MPYEAFANALTHITGSYARHKEDERKHARARAERESDIQSERSHQAKVRKENEDATIRVARESANINFATKLKEITELEPARAHQAMLIAAKSFGIPNAESLSPADLYTKLQKAKNDENAANVLAQALAQAAAVNTVADNARNDPKFATNVETDRQNALLRNKPQIDAAQAVYKQALQELDQLRAQDPGLSAVLLTPEDIARTKAQEFLSSLETMPPAQRDAALKAAVITAKTPAEARAIIQSNPVSWLAMQPGVDLTKEASSLNALTMANLRQSGYAERPEVMGAVQRINSAVSALVGFGVVPEAPTARNFFSPPGSPAPAPAVSKPGPAVNSPSGPTFNMPGQSSLGGAPASPVSSPVSAAPAPEPARYFAPPVAPSDLVGRSSDGGVVRSERMVKNARNSDWLLDKARATTGLVGAVHAPVHMSSGQPASPGQKFWGFGVEHSPSADFFDRVRALRHDPRSPLRMELLQKAVTLAKARGEPIPEDIAREFQMSGPSYWSPGAVAGR